jgi:hypothetical protein
MKHLDPSFRDTVAELDLEAIESSADPTFLVDRSFVIRGYNTAYVAFARVNGLATVESDFGLGCQLLTSMASPAREYYDDAFSKVLREHEVFHHDYECSSADTLRRYRLSAYPLPEGGGLVISHHLIHESPHDRPEADFGAQHVSPTGVVVQCSHCRKVQDHRTPNTWDWIPDLVREPRDNVSHTFCRHCLAHFYPGVVIGGS